METYSLLRHLADSWFLLGMTLFFVGAVAFLFRPGGRASQQEAALSIFRNDSHPAAASTASIPTASTPTASDAAQAARAASKEV